MQMEADWEFDVRDDAPVIDAQWAGLIDLRAQPSLAWLLPEAAELPSLAAALVKLNGAGSPVWTSKCDFWPALQPTDFDADELDAPSGTAAYAMSCYIDLMARNAYAWSLPEEAEAACRALCALLHQALLRSCRVDLVVRRAWLGDDQNHLGITAYITACGPAAETAKDVLERALAAFAAAICTGQTLQ